MDLLIGDYFCHKCSTKFDSITMKRISTIKDSCKIHILVICPYCEGRCTMTIEGAFELSYVTFYGARKIDEVLDERMVILKED